MSSPAVVARKPTDEVGTGKKGERILGIDAARGIACLAVIWLHCATVGSFAMLGFFRMPFFTILASLMVMRGIAKRPNMKFSEYLRGRVWRILVPYGVWWLVALVGALAMDVLGIRPFVWLSPVFMLLVGANGSLWYLPFIFAGSVLVFAVGRFFLNLPPQVTRRVGACLLIAEYIVLVLVPLEQTEGQTAFGMWPMLLPNVGIGVGVFLLLSVWHPTARWKGPLIAAAIALWGLGTACNTMDWGARGFWGSAAGLGLLMGGLWVPSWHWLGALASLGRISYGIYLVHWNLVVVIHLMIRRLHLNPWAHSLMLFIGVACLSVPLAWSLERYKFTRWTVGK